MNTINLIIWIFVYSVCLVHIALFAVIYSKHRHKIELFYLIVLINIFLLAVMVMLSLVLDIKNIIPITVNGILLLYITVPLCGYYLFSVNKKLYILIPILIITEAIIENILMIKDLYAYIYFSRIIFYILFILPALIGANKNEKNALKRTIQSITKKTIFIFLAFMIAFIPFSSRLFEVSYVSSLWWAVCTLSFQIPGLIYCKGYLFDKDNFVIASQEDKASSALNDAEAVKIRLLSLSKRENEAAIAICSGLTYTEIAEKMCVSLSTVKKHAFSVYRKLGIKNNRELMRVFTEAQTAPTSSPENNEQNESLS